MYRSTKERKHRLCVAREHAVTRGGRSKLEVNYEDLTGEERSKLGYKCNCDRCISGKVHKNTKKLFTEPVEGGEEHAYSHLGELLDRAKDPDYVSIPDWVTSSEDFCAWVQQR